MKSKFKVCKQVNPLSTVLFQELYMEENKEKHKKSKVEED